MASPPSRLPLSDEERDGIVLAVKSAFTKLKNLYQEITPILQRYGFTIPSAGVIARDLSERIETSIVQHCSSFSKGQLHCDVQRCGCEWEVKICKDSGLTINQSKTIRGENYIIVNYKANSQVIRIWFSGDAQDAFFSPRKANANARHLPNLPANQSCRNRRPGKSTFHPVAALEPTGVDIVTPPEQ